MVKQAVSTDWAEEVFDVEAVYVPGTVWVRRKYTYHNVMSDDVLSAHALSMPILVGREGKAMLASWVLQNTG